MIVLFTDFGSAGPYVGQMHGVLLRDAPGVPVVDLLHDVPSFDIRAAAYLLPALASVFPAGAVFVAVVDPGVGSARRPVMLRADDRWYVGPDNGLLRIVARRARSSVAYEILWRPKRLSASFHGRDLFAPVAARLATGVLPEHRPLQTQDPASPDWPDDLARVIYVDHYGNAITGLRAMQFNEQASLTIGSHSLPRRQTFSDVSPGTAFCYENSMGLLEIAVSCGSAAAQLGIHPGEPVTVIDDTVEHT